MKLYFKYDSLDQPIFIFAQLVENEGKRNFNSPKASYVLDAIRSSVQIRLERFWGSIYRTFPKKLYLILISSLEFMICIISLSISYSSQHISDFCKRANIEKTCRKLCIVLPHVLTACSSPRYSIDYLF